MRSGVTLEQYMYEIRHETNVLEKLDMFPNALLFKWIHKDILETILRLDGIINNVYRAVSGNLAISSAAAGFHASISHTASATTVTGFSGLTPDAWIGGAILAEDSDVLYCAQITDNDATTITISSGDDLPALSSVTVLLTVNDSGNYIDLSSLSMINFLEPIWQVKDGSGNPVEMIPLEIARNIANIPSYDNKVYWYQVGQKIYFALGDGASISGNVTVGYYVQPTEADALAEYIDFPWEWQNLAQQRTEIRILKTKGETDKAEAKRVDLEERYSRLEQSNLQSALIDKGAGERTK